MKSNSTTAVLLGVLAVSALTSVVLCMMWINNVREFRGLQFQVNEMQRNRMLATQLAGELVEYSKKNPAINPMLESVGIKQRAGAANGTQPLK